VDTRLSIPRLLAFALEVPNSACVDAYPEALVTRVFLGSAIVLLCGTTLLAQTPAGTAFSYQGRLTDAGAPATGVYDLQFTLWDAATGGTAVAGPLTIEDVSVTSGLFIVSLDFGPAFT